MSLQDAHHATAESRAVLRILYARVERASGRLRGPPCAGPEADRARELDAAYGTARCLPWELRQAHPTGRCGRGHCRRAAAARHPRLSLHPPFCLQRHVKAASWWPWVRAQLRGTGNAREERALPRRLAPAPDPAAPLIRQRHANRLWLQAAGEPKIVTQEAAPAPSASALPPSDAPAPSAPTLPPSDALPPWEKGGEPQMGEAHSRPLMPPRSHSCIGAATFGAHASPCEYQHALPSTVHARLPACLTPTIASPCPTAPQWAMGWTSCGRRPGRTCRWPGKRRWQRRCASCERRRPGGCNGLTMRSRAVSSAKRGSSPHLHASPRCCCCVERRRGMGRRPHAALPTPCPPCWPPQATAQRRTGCTVTGCTR